MLVCLTDSQLYKSFISNNYVYFVVCGFDEVTQRLHFDEIQVSLREISERLAMPIGQLHERADVIRRCELAEVPFEAIELELLQNGMIWQASSQANIR